MRFLYSQFQVGHPLQVEGVSEQQEGQLGAERLQNEQLGAQLCESKPLSNRHCQAAMFMRLDPEHYC